ncbi:DegV family protein [Enterococcus rivorum]|uniref:Fatty acid-binding protein DegV n=1 Tax=Enterococcus rivorum TaxID=762845 RepID=A0A1E5KYI5_9ENTE|nr:DegV family protein [Enterococcus rivorum]MBP2099570.1 DegV family protein with EDD domain [Enterococcus rivorum]OEH82888.1 fatty acid-binding protein DegV [Enterococcus rivorum]
MMETVDTSQMLDAKELLFAIQEGAKRLINEKQQLNQMNVFPVPDGDTGSNLASLMQTILEETEADFSSVKSIFEKVADASLVGARGNSGIIFAQYLNGIYNHLLTFEEPNSVQHFIKSAKAATKEAYQAIENPVEGTMITVIRIWSEALSLTSENENDNTLENILTNALNKAKRAVENTTRQLKILQQNKVVDAGAKGFYLFIEGFTQAFISNEKTTYVSLSEKMELVIPTEIHQNSEKPVFRYCTEVLLDEVSLSKAEIQQGLVKLGDSIIVAVNRGKARIHIHSNQPEDVLSYLRKIGTPLQQKADDMLLQYEVNQKQKHPIALVTDSIADLPEEYLLSNQIHVIPMTLLIDSTSYIDKITLKSNQFFELIKSSQDKPTSSQPSIKTVENLFSFLETRYKEILVITVADRLSGTYRSIKEIAKKRDGKQVRVEVIDSKQNSAAEGLLVMKANEWIEAGLDFDALVDKVKALRKKISIFVSVDTLEPMINSGRIPQTLGRIAERLSIKPIVSLDEAGNGKLKDFTFSLSGNERKIIKKIAKIHQEESISKYVVVHGEARDRAEKFAELIKQSIGVDPTYIMDISAVIAMSAGKGSVAVALISDEGE